MHLKDAINIVSHCLSNYFTDYDLAYIIERESWVINEVGRMLCTNLNGQKLLQARIVPTGKCIRNKIVHYGSKHTLLNQGKFRWVHKSNRTIMTWYHISNLDPDVTHIPTITDSVDFLHTSCSITKNALLSFGADPQKIVVIPIGVDTDAHTPVDAPKKLRIRRELSIPDNAICIGSFQKDGNGWGEGKEPKLIKGPDVFCDLVALLAKKYPVHVLLTGPARGYVKRRLTEVGVPFTHEYFLEADSLPDCYRALDLYIITSRIEGGPRSLLECMATGIPVVTTRVGQAPDIIVHGQNGYLADQENIDQLYEFSANVIEDDEIRNTFTANGLKTSVHYSMKNIARMHYSNLYKKLQ